MRSYFGDTTLETTTFAPAARNVRVKPAISSPPDNFPSPVLQALSTTKRDRTSMFISSKSDNRDGWPEAGLV